MSIRPFILVTVLFITCCDVPQKPATQLFKNECGEDSIIIDDPRSGNEYLRKIKENILRLSRLRNLETGFNEMQIRIGYAYSSDREDLIILTKENGSWSGAINNLKFNYDSVKHTHISIDRVSKSIVPVNGWEFLVNELLKAKILELPDMSAIDNYPLARDGNWLSVEFADCKKYRYYSYQSPWAYADLHWQAKCAVKISSIIEKEFGYSRLVK